VAGDERGGRRGEEHHGPGHLDRLPDAMQGGDALDDVGLEGGPESAFSVPDVRVNVGATQFTFTPDVPHSTARHAVRCAIPAFVMQ
jgi:hypothetical protein